MVIVRPILDIAIALHRGHNGAVETEPVWTGTIGEFWDEHPDWPEHDILQMAQDVRAGRDHRIGGDAHTWSTERRNFGFIVPKWTVREA